MGKVCVPIPVHMPIEVTLKVKKGSKHLAKKLPETTEVGDKDTAKVLHDFISKSTGTSVSRIRITVKQDKPTTASARSKDRVLQYGDLLSQFAVDNKIEVLYRDLGPQISWKIVFLIEYLGPLLIHPAFFKFRQLIYGSNEAPTQIQEIVHVCVMLHFVKREFETAFIHKFSQATMPLFNLFKNCSHYWLLSGVLVAYFGYAPASWWTGNASLVNKVLFYSGGIITPNTLAFWALPAYWLFSEVSNFIVHLNLSSLRPTGSTERRIPYGYGFNHVSCPNYYFESLGWLILSLFSCNWAMALFAVVGIAQMYAWAIKKHKRYLEEFPDYPKNRKPMFPYLG